MSSSPIAASVVVCTRNRSTLLRHACESMLRVDAPDGGWELLVIDNQSTDDTRDVAESVRSMAPDRVRLVVEPEIGLSAARNRGFQEAAGEIVVFIDDDAFPEPHWLTAIVAAFRHEDVACAGGPVEPVFEGDLPDWFEGRYLPYLTVWNPGSEPLDLRYNEYPRGANMAFRRTVYDTFGGFSTHLGRKADSLLSCEETELCLRIERGGLRTVYCPTARVRHTTPVDRLTPQWMKSRFAAQGESEAIIHWMHGGFGALVRGYRAHRGRVEEAARERIGGGKLFTECQRHARNGYRRGGLRAPLGIRRYRPPDPTVVLQPWPG